MIARLIDMAIYTDGSFCTTSLLGSGRIALTQYGFLLDDESIPCGVIHSIFGAEILTLLRVFELVATNTTKLDGATAIYVLTDFRPPTPHTHTHIAPTSPMSRNPTLLTYTNCSGGVCLIFGKGWRKSDILILLGGIAEILVTRNQID